MPTKTITLKVPSNIPKKKIIEAIKRLELEEKYKKTENFKLFVKDEDFKMKIYKIAEFVEKYLKKKYPKEEFEIILEQSGKLLKKRLRVYFSSNKEADKLTFKDIFRHAGLHSLLSVDEVERWLRYRDSRNQTSHEYGSNIADEVLNFIEDFIQDSLHLIKVIDDFKAD